MYSNAEHLEDHFFQQRSAFDIIKNQLTSKEI